MKKNLTKFAGRIAPLVRRSAPLIVGVSLVALRCEAAASPIARLVNDVASEATTTWAVGGAAIGLVTGLIGLKMDGGHNMKAAAVTLTGLSFALLSVQGIITYLQSE